MARILASVLGHQKQIHHLQQSLENGKLAPTSLFCGPSGIGKKLVAMAMAQDLLCERGPLACGECASCLRVARGQHESLMLVLPEKNLIKIEQSRAILDFLSFKSLTPNRVIIIDEVESLNPQAANSLLKILEEPSEGTYFFLIALSGAHVLSTIRSRCQVTQFLPLPLEEMRSKGQAPEWALKASMGSFERLQDFSDKQEIEARADAHKIIEFWLLQRHGFLQPAIRAIIKERAHGLILARHLVLFLRDAVAWQLGERDFILNPDQVQILEQLSKLPQAQLQKMAAKSLDLEGSLRQNRDAGLVFEQFWLESL